MADDILLEVKNLKTHFPMHEGVVRAVDGVDLTIRRGVTLGLVGESACGKSVTARSIMRLVPRPGKIVDGQITLYTKKDLSPSAARIEKSVLTDLDPEGEAIRRIRGEEIAMIFQEPMTSLSMLYTVGFQIMEAILLHQDVSKREARETTIQMLGHVGIPNPEECVDSYPFQLSGGMQQRVMIAMALVCRPALLLADEPTTSLDVTIQAQIMELLSRLQRELGMAILLITHDLGVVAETCEEVAVMYLGEIVEFGDVDSVFHDPLHPYTRALLRSIPKLGESRREGLEPIQGAVPDAFNRPQGCPFHPRCDVATEVCAHQHPEMIRMPEGHLVRCVHYYDDGEPQV